MNAKMALLAIGILVAALVLPVVATGRDTIDSKLGEPMNRFQLIDQAFREGKLNYETSLVQKMYALHSPERLRPEFRIKGGPPLKSGTLLYLEIKQNWDRLSKETQDLLWPYLLRPTQAGEDSLSGGYGHSYTTDDTASWVTPSGHFRVWYVRSTEDAPDMTDENPQDGVPDWINLVGKTLDHVWAYEIDGLGYREPIKDGDYSYYYQQYGCLLYTSPSPRDRTRSRMPSSA